MTASRKRLTKAFGDQFRYWRIRLPKANVAQGTPGFIHRQGWLIQFCFGTDAMGEYLDYYAAHRMTGDSHVRLYEDGTTVDLPAIQTMHVSSDDPAEARRLAEANQERNREVLESLVAKGFDKATINMMLGAGIVGDSE